MSQVNIKTCVDCVSVRDVFICSFYWGQIWEAVREHIFEVEGNISESGIASLTVAARERICAIIEEFWLWDDGDI